MLVLMLLKTTVLPAAIFTGALGALAPPWRGKPIPARRAWMAGAAAAVAFAIAAPVVFGRFDPWPVRGERWLPHAALIAAVGAAIIGLGHRAGRILKAIVPSVSLAIGAALLALPILRHSAGAPAQVLWIACLAVTAAAIWWSAESLARRGPMWTAPAALAMVACGASLMLIQSASAVAAQLAGTLTALAAAALALALWNPAMSIAGGGAGVLSAILCMILIVGHFYSGGRTPILGTLTLGAALPLAWALSTLEPLRPGWRRGLLIVVPALVSAAVAVVWTLLRGGAPSL